MSRLLIALVLSLPVVLAGCAQTGKGKAPAAQPARPAATKPEAETVAKPPTAPKPEQEAAARKAQVDFNAGLKAYEDGDYKVAGSRLQAALDGGLASKTDQVTAYKHLAFLACAANQRETCKAHFRRAFAINPRFKLNPTEAGHPIWGPVFKEVAAERAAKGATTP